MKPYKLGVYIRKKWVLSVFSTDWGGDAQMFLRTGRPHLIENGNEITVQEL